MKTYEEMTESIIRKTKERKNKLEARRKRISFIAAAAAMVIVITSIPVGSLIISHRADQPVETTSAETDPKETVTTPNYTVTTHKDNKTIPEDTVFIKNLNVSEDSGSVGELTFEGQTELYLDTTYDGATESDGGYMHKMKALCVHKFAEENNNYQADIVLTDGNEELYHITYNGEICTFEYQTVIFTFDLFIPDGLDTGEVHFYFNVLNHDTKTTDDYKTNPFGEACTAFAKKYEWLVCSNGVKTPESDCASIMAEMEENLSDQMYWIVYELYNINKGLESAKANGDEKYEEYLRLKKYYEKALISYREENEEEYNDIILKFIEESPKYYDKDGNIRYIDLRHDPLDDVGDLAKDKNGNPI